MWKPNISIKNVHAYHNVLQRTYAAALYVYGYACTDITILPCIQNMHETFTMSPDGLYGTLNSHNTNAVGLFDGLSKPLFSYRARPQTHEIH